jgi:hypothetical protein
MFFMQITVFILIKFPKYLYFKKMDKVNREGEHHND